MDATPPPVTAPELATLDQELGSDSAAVIHSLASRLEGAGRVSDLDVFVEAVLAREALGSTVLPGGIAMPQGGLRNWSFRVGFDTKPPPGRPQG